MKERKKIHKIGEKDRGSEIDGDLREGKRNNRERDSERGSVVSRERRSEREMKLGREVIPEEWKRKKRSEEKTLRERKNGLRGGGREDYLRD